MKSAQSLASVQTRLTIAENSIARRFTDMKSRACGDVWVWMGATHFHLLASESVEVCGLDSPQAAALETQWYIQHQTDAAETAVAKALATVRACQRLAQQHEARAG